MANTIDFILTNAASELISKVLSGKTLNFTRMAVGDGFSYDATAAKDYTALVNEVLSIDITKSETLSASSVKVTSAFKNTDALKEFYYREVGLFAQDPDTGEEILYAYGNRNDAAELITPTGSSVVTKQLVFIISVGDSANVTFNVNADVYALQEDMLNVQENKADRNLANTGMITNCLLEVPQRIKYELTSAGTLTIKAGTIFILPYGTATPTYAIGDNFLNETLRIIDYQYKNNKLFYYLELQSDKDVRYTSIISDLVLTIGAGASISIATREYCSSGPTAPKTAPTRQFWYDTTNNYIYNFSSNSNVADSNVLALPIMNLNCTASNVFSLNEKFNGMGYIGSTFWVDKGVKGLVSDGFHENGIRASIHCESNDIYTYTFDGPGYDGDYIISLKNLVKEGTSGLYFKKINGISYQKEKPTTLNTWWYDVFNNQWKYINDKGDTVNYWWLDICECTLKSGIITSLKPYSTFRIINKSTDKGWLSSLSFPSEKFIDYELGERGSTYTAPANGWFALRKDAGFINAQVSLAVWNSEESFEFFRTTKSSPAENTQITCFIPILKGQKLAVDYDATGTTIYFRFIYAQGEVI